MEDKTALITDEPAIRIDSSLVNAITEMGTSADKSEHTRVGVGVRLTKEDLERLYRIRICQRVCDAIPESAVLRGWEVTLGEKANPKITSGMNSYQEELDLQNKFKQAQIQANIYGGAVIIMAIDDGRPASEPVNKDKIQSVKALYVRDRHKVRPVIEEAIDVTDPDHYEYIIQGDREREKLQHLFPDKNKNYGYRIHKSRILRFDGVEFPPDMAEQNDGWGGSILESIWEDYRDYKGGLKSVATMLNDFSLFIYSIRNLDKIIKANDEDLLKSRIKFMQMMTSVFGGVAIDAEGEKIEYATRNFGGVDAVIDRLRDAFIGSTNIPHDRLFGESPSGLGATGESEERNWSHTIEAFQVSRWLKPLRRGLRCIFLAADSPTKGKEPPDWGVKFHNMMPESDADKSSARSTQAQTDNTYVTAGVLLPEEIRKSRFGSAQYSFETQLDDELWEENKQMQEQLNSFGMPEEVAPVEEPATEEAATLDSLHLDGIKKKSKPTKPGHTWVEDKTVKGGGYWRKLPKGSGTATALGAVAIAGIAGAAIYGASKKQKAEPEISPALSGDRNFPTKAAIVGATIATTGGMGAIALSQKRTLPITEPSFVSDEINSATKLLAPSSQPQNPRPKPKYVYNPHNPALEELIERAEKYHKESNLTSEEIAAIKDYSEGKYKDMNEFLRDPNSEASKEILARDPLLPNKIDLAKQALTKLSPFTGTEVVLTLEVSANDKSDKKYVKEKERQLDYSEPLNRYVGNGKEIYERYQEGQEIKDLGFGSTTIHKEPFDNGEIAQFAQHENLAVLRINWLKDGQTSGKYIDNFKGNKPGLEGEVLFPPDTKYSVKSKKIETIEVSPGNYRQAYVIELDEVPRSHFDSGEPDVSLFIVEAAKRPIALATEEWINVLDKWLSGFDSLEEADTQLAEAYDLLKDEKFIKSLERHNTLAHLAGRAEIIDEDIEND